MSFTTELLNIVRKWRYPGSQAYWENRYAGGGNSGAGSSGRLAEYKAGFVNEFVREHAVRSVVEFGCGDGQQLSLASFPAYTGLDIAPAAVDRCLKLFEGDPAKKFALYDPVSFHPESVRAEVGLSMEVIFHLTEDDLYEQYLRHLFAAATRFVVIFSSDEAGLSGGRFPHFKSRHFTSDIPWLAPDWHYTRLIQNPHRDISISDFHIFEHRSACHP